MRGILQSIRFDWGLDGLNRLLPDSDAIVIVDVLSFSTTVNLAVERGAVVYPYSFRDATAARFAESLSAELLCKRDKAALSLSPSSMLQAKAGQRLVLPSENGSTLAFTARERGKAVVAGCLRNAVAVAEMLRRADCKVSVIASGERWPNGGLRFAVEDLLGAGAILHHLADFPLSSEARVAVGAFQSLQHQLEQTLMTCASGQELSERGFKDDVCIASCLNESTVVPILRGGAFTVWE